MNKIEILREVIGPAPAKYVLGGGDLYINGVKVQGVLDFKANLVDPNEVASVTITLGVTSFAFGTVPTVQMRD